MNIIEISLLMDTGFGVEPEVLLLRVHNNFLSVRLSKKFKGVRHYHEFDVAYPVINKNYKEELQEKTLLAVATLQNYIDDLAE